MNSNLELAIIGMSCRFPGAKNIDEFWQNLRDGIESISRFDEQELLASGVDTALLHNPNYVKANGVLSNIELFDASFFDFSAKEAQRMDPQHRLFLEHAWEVMENAGYDTQTYKGSIGVYAGTDPSSYLLHNLDYNSEPEYFFQRFLITNDKDYLPTRVSYKLNLKGPSISVQTACSTSLVAVHMACQSLLNGECDMALAGGISIQVPQKAGYFYQEGSVTSPDGHCRAFDDQARGTVFGSGVGIVVLKRLELAIADGDCIHAVIKGSAVNNDGSLKLSYTAPSIDGQTAVISEAQSIAGIAPDTISYTEAHGTATDLGDPIEVAALTQAFRVSTQRTGFCAIGSVKTNFGHLGAAAGVASLIKTVLALKHQQIPPSLHFEQPNPKIDFANSPFYVNTQLSPWETDETPRRAGVSSFGIGGTNAHVILEEAPLVKTSGTCRPWQLLVLSSKTSSALEKATANLAEHLKQHPELNLADVAYTLQVGRQAFEHRRMLVCQNLDDAVTALESLNPQRTFTHYQQPGHRPVVFMFSGQGTQYANMARELYEVEPIFQETVDICSDLLKPHLGLDLRQVLYPSPEQTEEASQQLKQTAIAQPALFVIEYALAKLWMKWGVEPVAAIGHSIGEYVAATLAGVFSLEEALTLVAARSQLMQQLPPGAMLAVPLSEEEVRPLLGETLSLAAVNAPSSCVVSGSTDTVETLQSQLASQGENCRRLHTSHAFHSQMMEPILESFTLAVKQVKLQPPQFPYISNVTGTWITPQEATDPDYWASHLRQTVRFAAGLQELLKEPAQILLEVGPGRALSQLAKQHSDKHAEQVVLTSVRHPQESQSDVAFLLNTLGRLWLSGVEVDWSGFSEGYPCQRLPLPTYPFERQRYWIEPQQAGRFLPKSTARELWQALVKAGQRQASQGIPEFDEQIYLENRQGLDRLCIAYLNQTLRRLGAFRNLDETHSLEQLFEQCRILPRYQQLLGRWLQVLVEQGHLQQAGEFFTNLKPLSADSIATLLEEVRVSWADTPKLVDLVQHCGESLAAILVGEKEPLEFFNALIYQNENSSNPEIPLFGYCTSILQKSLEQVVKLLPAGANLRILEIGAGMGITTAKLLPLLPSEQTHYTFTDIGAWFLKQAQQTFSDYPFIEYRLLDIENSPQEQGFESHSFDIVIASNVLHVTRNLGETLQHVRSLLAPEGFLLLWETTQPQLDFDISWGLLMNPIEDKERTQGNPFLSAAQWQEALRTYGFVEEAAFLETEALGHQIIVARASSPADLATPTAFTTTRTSKDAEQTLSSSKKPDIADWFYIPSWKRSLPPKPVRAEVEATQSGCWLVFADECSLGTQLVKRLEREGQEVVIVRTGEHFSKETQSPSGLSLYTLNPRQRDDYDTLLEELGDRNLTPKTIVHLWSVTPHDSLTSGLEGVDLQDKGFYSLLFLAQALGKNSIDELQIAVVSNNMQAVTGEERLCPEKATLLGAVRVIPLEYPNIRCRSLDVIVPPTGSWQEKKLTTQLLAELNAPSSDPVIAYRGAHRWVQAIEPIRLDKTVEDEETPQLREGGVYLITGGLGAIGLTLASHLAKTVRAKLVLTGRSPFPAREDWSKWLTEHGEDDDITRKIRKVRELEELGADVLIISADVSNLEQMQDAIAQVQERFGQLNGVIHAAGVLGDSAIGRKTLEQVESVLAPKVKGTLVLDALLEGVELDFFALCSSGAAIQPLFGQVAYAGANNFLDAFAHYKTGNGTFAVSINWEGWQESGMGVEGTKRLAVALGRESQPQSKPVSHPLLDRCLVEGNEQEIYSHLSVSKHWVLDEHRLAGKATLPGTAYLELVRAACESHAQNRTIEIRDIYFLTPLVVEDDEEKEVRTLLKKRGDGLEFVIMSQLNSAEFWQEHARGEIAFIEAQSPEQHEIQEIEARCEWQELIVTEPKLQTELVEYGSRWNAISKQAKLSSDQGLILLEMPEVFAADLNSYKLHPALLDFATGFFTIQDEGTYLPFSYKNLRIKGSLPSKLYSHIKVIENNPLQNDTLKFSITIMDEQGTELVKIEEYTLRKVERGKADVTIAKQSGDQGEKIPTTPESENFYLSISSPGNLDTLIFQPTTRQKPEPGEVEIEVSAAGLNFKEVLIALGLIPVPTDSAYKFGFECAGKIVALGEGVTGLEIGNEVMAFAPSCFSQFTTTSAEVVALKPGHLSLEEAATIPVAFTTAYTALMHFGRLCRGEKILIHAAAGGVGLAAIQIAQWVGAEIFATAGSSEKRQFLRSLGIEHVMDSRSLAFADEVMKHTNGKGVDVVLNSLGGEFIPQSLSVLAPYGRFLELGQRDIFNNSQLGLKAFEKHLSFFAIQADPKLPSFNPLWREVVQHFNEGNFSPIPHQVFPIQSVTKAFESMAGAKHIGKLIVSLQEQEDWQVLVTSQNKLSQKATKSVAAFPSSVGFDWLENAAPTNGFSKDFREKNWLLPSEGIEVFNRILGSTLPQVLVSTTDLAARSEQEPILRPRLASKTLEETNRSKPTSPKTQLSNSHTASGNEIEEILVNLWQEVLGGKQLGIRDNFFELGGDSLIAVQVMSQVREIFQIDVPVSSLFDNPTVAGLAESIEAIRKTTELQAPAGDSSDNREEIML